jgi:2-polyprenyl-3-methyl-5-hydroxy-6-metoxy-1,4-benzoquinol methylase
LDQGNHTEIESYYSSDYYWQTAQRSAEGAGYDPQHRRVRIYRRALQVLAQYLPHKGRLLDVGCAKGVFLDVARRQKWQVVGLEISEWASQYARKELGLDVWAGTLEDAPWPDASFDAITAFDLIEHLVDPEGAIARARRLLREDGMLLIETPNASSVLHLGAELAFKLTAIKWPLVQIYGIRPGGHVAFFDRDSLAHLLHDRGFEVVRVSYDPIGQALWRPLTQGEKLARWVDSAVGGLRGQYHMMTLARRR